MKLNLPNLQSDVFVHPTVQYVAFLDVLGFGDLVLKDWEKARELFAILAMHSQFVEPQAHLLVPTCKPKPPGNKVRVDFVFDSIILSGTDLYDVAYIAQHFQFGSLMASRLLRGCIARGAHAVERTQDGLFILSKAEVLAVRGESRAEHPRVIVDSSITPEAAWSPDEVPENQRLLLADIDGAWLVNPFIFGCEQVAKHKVDVMLSEHFRTEHVWKYQWLRSLFARLYP